MPEDAGILTVGDRRPFTLDEVLRGRRSIRRYAPRAVPDALVREILDLARHAPSSLGAQPWCFVVIRSRETLERLAAIKDDYCAAGMVTVGIGSNTWAGGDNSVNFGWTGHLAGATVTIDGEPVVEGGSLTGSSGT